MKPSTLFRLLALLALGSPSTATINAEALEETFEGYSVIDRWVPTERWCNALGNPWEITNNGRSGKALKGKDLDETGAARPGEIHFKLEETISPPKSMKLWIYIAELPESFGQSNPVLMIQLTGKANLGGVPKVGGAINIGIESAGHIRQTFDFDVVINSPKTEEEPKGISKKLTKQVSANSWTPVEMEFSPDGSQFRARIGTDEQWLEWQPFRLPWGDVENLRLMRRGMTVMVDDLSVEY